MAATVSGCHTQRAGARGATYLADHVVATLIGRDAHQIEDTWQYLYRGAYWRRGPVTMSAIAAVDTALWDLKAKAAGMPLYQLLGAPAEPVYGFMATRMARRGGDHRRSPPLSRLGLHGDPPAVRRAGSRLDVRRIARQNVLRAGRRCVADGECLVDPEVPGFRAQPVRGRASGPRLGYRLVHDTHHRLTPIEAARLGKDLEPYRLFWLEIRSPRTTRRHFASAGSTRPTPLRLARFQQAIWDCKQLIEEQLIDYIRSTVVHAGGISHLRRIATLADLYNVKTGCHGATDLSPVCMAAALHFNLSIPNFGLQEYMATYGRD